MPRRYPPEFRRKALELLKSGCTAAEVAADIDVSEQTVYNWRNQGYIETEQAGRSPIENVEVAAVASKRACERRTQILAAARELAVQNELGLEAITVRAVSARAGIAIGTLRRHFPSQRELIDAVVIDTVDVAVDDSVVTNAAFPVQDRLTHAVLQLCPLELEDRTRMNAWLSFYASPLGSPTRKLVENATAQCHRNFRNWLGTLAESGALDATDIDVTANTLISLIKGLVLEAATPGSPISIPLARTILESTVHDILDRAGKGPAKNQ